VFRRAPRACGPPEGSPYKGNVMMSTLAFVALLLAAAQATGGDVAARGPAMETAPVVLDGQVLFRIRGVSALPAEERAAGIRERIEAFAQDPELSVDTVRPVDSDVGVKIMGGDQPIMGLYDADAQAEGMARRELAFAIAERIRRAVAAYRAARSPERLMQAAVYTLAATGLLVAAVLLVLWLARRVDALAERYLHRRIHGLEIGSFELVRAERIWGALRSLLRGLRNVVIAVLALAYLHYVLGRFPGTRVLADHLLAFVSGPLLGVGQTILAAIPNLVFLTVLFLVVRTAVRIAHLFFDAVERGAVTLHGFQPEWASPTFKIVRLALVAFGLIVAYPYIPGSQSAAFKGISLFLGVVFSLGSSSAISNMIAGYTLTYRRAFKLGDRVRIGDVIGDVIETRLQVTHVRSLKNEEVIIPNSTILNGQVVNYSSLASKEGLILHTSVGIGYEVPWRQVEAMLLMAAARTPGLLGDPPPFVLQQALADFAVNYELNVYCGDAHDMMQLYTALHRNVLDVFNEYGVQIMTPAYVSDPAQAKVVPPEQWHAAPATPDKAVHPIEHPAAPSRDGSEIEGRVLRAPAPTSRVRGQREP
jgi:small-conductance mechanosensitive channel